MKRTFLILFGLLHPGSALRAQESPHPVGVTTVAGVEIEYRCTPVPEGAHRFYSEGSFENRDRTRPPELPSYVRPIPGLDPVVAAVSEGSGTGQPLGDFEFIARWAGYQPGMVVVAVGDIFRTSDGDLYADELFTGAGTAAPPNALMHGAFTFTGGTGRYANAFGSASGFAQQLGDGTHTAFVTCGWIDGLEP